MGTRSLSQAFPLTGDREKAKLEQIQTNLECIPGTFYALFWLYTHDFLYVSNGIEKILGHPYKNFENHGMVFFTSLIPAGRIDQIYRSMYEQTAKIETHPDYLLAPILLKVETALLNSKMQPVPVRYNAVILDTKAFDPPSYLVFCSWMDISGKAKDEISQTEEDIKELLLDVKQLYFSGNPKLYKMLLCRKTITEREKEVAYLLGRGHNTKSIGEQLNISFNTVETHRKHLLEKLQAKNTAELVFKMSSILNPRN